MGTLIARVPSNVHHQSKRAAGIPHGTLKGIIILRFQVVGGRVSAHQLEWWRQIHRLDPPRAKLCQPDREASALLSTVVFFTG